MKASGYLVRFIGWSIVFAVVYVLSYRYYAKLVTDLADLAIDFIVPLGIAPHPKGFVLTSPDVPYPMGMPYDLFSIALNMIFAPVLVLTTVRANVGGLVRAVLSVAIMLVLHSLHVMSIVLYFLTRPENTALPVHFSESAVVLISWTYKFIDKMGYALFPFLAWAIVCGKYLGEVLRSQVEVRTQSEVPSPNKGEF